jgi:hypothetical protein
MDKEKARDTSIYNLTDRQRNIELDNNKAKRVKEMNDKIK